MLKMNCRFSDSMSITLLLQILCLGSAAAFLGDDLSTAARIRGTTQVQTASINASSLLSSGESTLHLGYMPAEDYGLNESVTFRRGLTDAGHHPTNTNLPARRTAADVTNPTALLASLRALTADGDQAWLRKHYITININKNRPLDASLEAYLTYYDTNQIETNLRQVIESGQNAPVPWRYGQGFQVTMSPQVEQDKTLFNIQWLPRSHLGPPLPNKLVNRLKVTCTNLERPAGSNLRQGQANTRDRVVGAISIGNATQQEAVPLLGACLRLDELAGADLFFTEKFSGCSLVITENPADNSLTIAHVEPDWGDDWYKFRLQESLQHVNTTMDGRACRVVFGPKQYMSLRNSGTSGEPGLALTPVYFNNEHLYTRLATVFGVRSNKKWTIFAQIYQKAEDGDTSPGNVQLKEVLQLWPPERLDLYHGCRRRPGDRVSSGSVPGSLGEAVQAIVPPVARAVSDLAGRTSARSAQADLAIASRNHTAAALRTPESEIREATALWRRQASKEDRLTMVPYRGPKAYLTRFNRRSPEVRKILNEARKQAAATVAAAQASYSPRALAQASTARAVQAIAMAAEGVSPAKASQQLMPQSFSLTSKFAWNGGNSYAMDWSSVTSNELVNSAIEHVYDTLAETAPWLNIKEYPLPGNPLMDMQLTYNNNDKSVTFTAVSGNYRYLLALAQQQVAGAFGVTIPVPQKSAIESSSGTTAVRMIFRDGLQELSVGLGGSWTASSIASAIGVSWPLEDDLFSISAPSVVFTNLPVALEISMLVDIPDLKVSRMTSALMLQPRGGLTLELYGSFTPIPHLTVNSMVLAAVKDVGLSATAAGTLINMPVAVRATIASKTKAVTYELTASKVNIGDIVGTIFGASMVPDFLLQVIKPMTFTTVTFTYAASKFAITAVPDINGAPALRTIINAVGLNASDLSLRMGPEALALGVSREYLLDLPHPFTGPAQSRFSVGLDAATKGVALSASFAAALRADGVKDPVGLAVSATVAAGANSVGVLLGFTGSTTTSITFQDAPFISIGTMQLAASIVVAKPPTLQSLTLAGSITVLGASADGLITYDQATRAMAFRAQVADLNLQNMLQSVGVNVKLGILNPILHEASVSVSTVDIPALNVLGGVYVRAKWDLLGLRKDIAFRLEPGVGVEFYVVYDVSELSRLINDALGELDKIINAAGRAMQDGSSHLIKSREEAQRKLDEAQAGVDKAQRDVESARGAFEAARRKADADLRNAQQRVASADRAFKDAVNQANAALSKARSDFAVADRAFEDAKRKAQQDLTNARNAVNQAQRNYDAAIVDAHNRINNAQASVNHLWGRYNHFSRRCNGWPWNWHNCVAAGAHWVAYQTATGVLAAARGFLNNIANSAVRWVLDRARDTLWAAERTAQGVLSGTHWLTRETALGVLHAAEKVAQGVLRGTEFIALEGAQAILAAANKVAEGVLIGAEAAAIETAQAGLVVAEATLHASEEVATSSLTALSEALDAVGGALASVKTENFIQVYSFGYAVKLKTSEVAFGVKCHFKIAGRTVDGVFALDLTDPVGSVMKLVVGEATKALKDSFKAIAPFLP